MSLPTVLCEPCQAGGTPLTMEEINTLLPEIPGWEAVERDGIYQLLRCFTTDNFVTTMALATKIADLAEEYGHHPLLQVEWGKLTVIWWTHKINGLHQNDFIMAKHTSKACGL